MPLTRGRRPTGRCAGPARSRRAAAPPRRTRPARSNSSQVASWSGRPSTRSRAAASRASTDADGLGDHDERRPAPQHPPALGQQREQRVQRQPVDHAAQHDAAGRAVRHATPGAPTPRRWSPSSPCSMARSATAPRGSTPCASAPRSSQRAQQVALTAVGMDDHAARRARQHVRRHRPGQRAELARRDEPGRTVHRPVLGGQPGLERLDARRQEAERLDDVAHRLFEVRLLAVRRARPARSRRGRSRSSGPVRRTSPRLGGQRRRRAPRRPGWYGP